MMFLVSDATKFAFLRKLGRSHSLFNVGALANVMSFVTSILILALIKDIGYNTDAITKEEIYFRKLNNIVEHIEIKFEYLFSLVIACLVIKILEVVQYDETIGPLFTIVGKMAADFVCFILVYACLLIPFTVIGVVNFAPAIEKFRTFFDSAVTVLDTSVGNYDFEDFGNINKNLFLTQLGTIYTVIIVILFNILILNLLIAVLANTYQMFNTKATGLYLSKILAAR